MDWKELENYIEKNREALDVEEPREKVWTDIEQKLNQPRLVFGEKVLAFPVWKVAAVVLIGTAAILLLQKNLPTENAQNMAGSFPTESVYQFSAQDFEELKEVHIYFKGKVALYEQQFESLDEVAEPTSDTYLGKLAEKQETRRNLETQFEDNPQDGHILFSLVEAYQEEAEVWETFFEAIGVKP